MQKVKLHDICTLERGSSPRPIQDYITTAKDGVNWIKIGDTNPNEKYVNKTAEKITKEGAKKSRKVEIGDFILSNSMSLGHPFIMNINGYIHDGWFVLRPDYKKVDRDFLYYSLLSDYVQTQFKGTCTGSVVKNIRSELVNDLDIFLPDITEQKRIAKVLSSIDRKISVNREINRNLEELAKQIYDYWFVQFDFPNEDGKPYKSSGGKMIWNETLKRDIPIGWEVKKINELAEIQKYQITPKENIEYKHYSLPNFDKYESYSIENGNSIFSDKFFVENGNLLISKLNPWTDRTVWVDNVKNAICSTEYVVLKQKDKCIQSYLNQIAHTQSFIDYCTSCSTGTSHSHRRVKPELMTGYKIPFQENIVKAFGKQTYQIIKKKLNIQNENRNLITLRDELLPLLMSGQVTLNSCLSAD